MRISVEIGFSFKWDVGGEGRTLDLPAGATVRDALAELARRHPAAKRQLFESDGTVRRSVNALVNGENVRFRRQYETTLRDSDRLSILPPIGGG